MDLLRTRHRERRLLEVCLETQARFAVDNTNPTAADRQRYIGPAKQAGYFIIGYFFQSAGKAALARNRSRPLSEQVPDRGILGTRARLELPTYAEGFDELHYVSIGPDGTFVVEPWQL
jgi:predicted kinase